MKNVKYNGQERRKTLRVNYKPDERPTLKVGENEFKVADFSERGLRFFYNRRMELEDRVCGKLTLLCGESIDVDGMIVRKEKEDMYINLKTPIQKKILDKEQQYINDN